MFRFIRPEILKCDQCDRIVDEVCRLGDERAAGNFALSDAPHFDICVECTDFVLRHFRKPATTPKKAA